MTNSAAIAAAVDRQWMNQWLPEGLQRRHLRLRGGRASAAERDPPALVEVVLKALRCEL